MSFAPPRSGINGAQVFPCILIDPIPSGIGAVPGLAPGRRLLADNIAHGHMLSRDRSSRVIYLDIPYEEREGEAARRTVVSAAPVMVDIRRNETRSSDGCLNAGSRLTIAHDTSEEASSAVARP
jgi:hypothetical protein